MCCCVSVYVYRCYSYNSYYSFYSYSYYVLTWDANGLVGDGTSSCCCELNEKPSQTGLSGSAKGKLEAGSSPDSGHPLPVTAE
jgi:hypothetical protein